MNLRKFNRGPRRMKPLLAMSDRGASKYDGCKRWGHQRQARYRAALRRILTHRARSEVKAGLREAIAMHNAERHALDTEES